MQGEPRLGRWLFGFTKGKQHMQNTANSESRLEAEKSRTILKAMSLGTN